MKMGIEQDVERAIREITQEGPVVNPKFTICRSRFAYRMTGEICSKICAENNIRIQELLDDDNINSYVALRNTITERWNPNRNAYERTEKSLKNGPESLLLQIGRIDAVYPHQITSDGFHKTVADETMDEVKITFPMIGLKEHISGKINMYKADEGETRDQLMVRLAKYLSKKNLMALTEVESSDLAYRLGLPEQKIGTVIIPKWKMPIVRIGYE